VLTVTTTRGLARRDFLRVGALGLGGLTLPGWLAARAHAAERGADWVRDRAVVFVYLSGGASHIETFNPNPDAPAPYRSLTGALATRVPGVSFGGTFPRLAQRADRLAIVRSFHHQVSGHAEAHVHVLSGATDPRGEGKDGQSVGSLVARLRGANDPRTGMPSYALLTHSEVDGQYQNELERVRRGSWSGALGPAYGPFESQGSDGDDSGSAAGKSSGKRREKVANGARSLDGGLVDDLELHVPLERLERRRELLAGFDRLRQIVESRADSALAGVGAAARYQEQAFDLVLGAGARAFDLTEEPRALHDRYDTSDIRIGHKTFRPSTLGRQMLTARRLVEAGCAFVTVHSAGWDMHADGNNPGIVDGMRMLGTSLDRALAAFLDDLAERGLADKVLVVVTGDFGRTPKVNARGGRDHWAPLGTLAFAGGGLPGGAVVGRSDRHNATPDSTPVTPASMMGTIFHVLFDVGQLRVARDVPRDVLALVEASAPIPELV